MNGSDEPPTADEPAPFGQPVDLGSGPSADPTVAPPPAPPPFAWGPRDESITRPTARPATRFTRAVEAVAWVVGIAAVLFFGRVYAILRGPMAPTSYEIGVVIGTIAAAVIVAALVRWVVVKIRGRGGLRSPWILVVAALILLVGVGRQAGLDASVGPGRPIDSYLEIAAPFSLSLPTAGEKEELRTAIADGLGTYEVRRVLDGGGLVGFLIVGDINVGPSPDWGALERGFEGGSGGDAQRTTVAGRTAIVGSASSAATVMWIESPYILVVYGIDADSARLMAELVIASYDRAAA